MGPEANLTILSPWHHEITGDALQDAIAYVLENIAWNVRNNNLVARLPIDIRIEFNGEHGSFQIKGVTPFKSLKES